MGQKKTRDKEGRPTVMTEEALRKVEEAFAWGCTDLEACFFADISKTALYNYQLAHPEFKERKDALKSRPILAARRTVLDGITGVPAQYDDKGNVTQTEIPCNPDLALKFLERVKKDEFGLRREVTGPEATPLLGKNLTRQQVRRVGRAVLLAAERFTDDDDGRSDGDESPTASA